MSDPTASTAAASVVRVRIVCSPWVPAANLEARAGPTKSRRSCTPTKRSCIRLQEWILRWAVEFGTAQCRKEYRKLYDDGMGGCLSLNGTLRTPSLTGGVQKRDAHPSSISTIAVKFQFGSCNPYSRSFKTP